MLKMSLHDSGTYLHCSRIRHDRRFPPCVYCLPICCSNKKRVDFSVLLFYMHTAGICPENFLSSLLERVGITPWQVDKRKQWEMNSFCRFKCRLWQGNILCDVAVFFSEETMEHKLTMNILLRTHYLNMSTNFKPLIFTVGYFFFL